MATGKPKHGTSARAKQRRATSAAGQRVLEAERAALGAMTATFGPEWALYWAKKKQREQTALLEEVEQKFGRHGADLVEDHIGLVGAMLHVSRGRR